MDPLIPIFALATLVILVIFLRNCNSHRKISVLEFFARMFVVFTLSTLLTFFATLTVAMVFYKTDGEISTAYMPEYLESFSFALLVLFSLATLVSLLMVILTLLWKSITSIGKRDTPDSQS